MVDDTYGPSITHLEWKIFLRKFLHVEPVTVPIVLKNILDIYK